MHIFSKIGTVCIFVVLALNHSNAQVRWDLSLDYYFESSETAYFDPPDRFSGLGSGIGLKGKAAFPWGNRFIGGVYLGFNPSVEVFRFDESFSIIELGFFVGPRFDVGNHEIIATGEIGFRKIASSFDAIDGQGLGTNLNISMVFNKDKKISPKAELGFIAQPTGGNDDVTFTFSPYWYIGGGIVIN
jgi:hypothetical protein